MESHKLFEAQTHILHHTFSFINSMSLKCAIDMSIPDVIHKYGQPMPLSILIASLPIHPSKTNFIYRLMRILTHSGFFSQYMNNLEVSYDLTDASRLLVKDHSFSVTPFVLMVLDPTYLSPWNQFSSWFKSGDPTPFFMEHGVTLYDHIDQDPKHNHMFNDAMASNARLVSSMVIQKCKGVFKGLKSLVDVGGGTGTMAMAIAKLFPQLDCIVFDLPHVVAGLQGSDKNLKYVGGDMFEAIPPADSILLKWILHNWNDEECVKMLKKCKEAITREGKEGKVIIIDMVMMENENVVDDESVETKLFFDLQMMVFFNAKERNEKEWAKLFFSSGFTNYKITPLLGLNSLIEVYQ
ncbi:hypothetical protein Lal_00029244 [Lupinus albus]|uniref:isoflavone 7-O-methyltransferase n=1 Tax=Lupinus albus TaxID=3870 RepID=A0A6A4NYL7_LUPAL|nr:putative catechol O-methyltransferase [Lupinus albus]KAF1885355.1 hypothetical protein Lal_00029244 [Lupinus albus]